MMANAMELAANIAAKSPVAIQGTKVNLNYARDHSIADCFEYAVCIPMYSNEEIDPYVISRAWKSVDTYP